LLVVVPFFLAALVAAPALAQSPEQQKQITELEKQLDELKKKLADLKGAEGAKAAPKPIEIADMATWRAIRGAALSNDGEWFAARIGPNEGDGEVILRQTKREKEHKFPAGGSGFGGMSFSHDSKWFAFTINPPYRPPTATPTTPGTAAPAQPPAQGKVALVNLATGEKVEYEGIRRFSFSGESVTHLALHKNPASAPAPDASQASPSVPPAIAALFGRGAAPERPTGSDLILRELATGNELTLGNVAEFAFDKKGRFLAMTVDAQGQLGNGVQLRNMSTAALVVLDSGKATYRGLNWTEDGDALAVLKGVDDKAYEGKLHSILGFKNFAAGPEKVVFDPAQDSAFPKNMTISPNGSAYWREDLGGLVFGIAEVKKKDEKPAAKDIASATPEEKGPNGDDRPNQQPRGPRRGGAAPAATTTPADKPDIVIWHYKDSRLQPMQQVQANADKNYTYNCFYRVKDKKFLRLADDDLKLVSVPRKGDFAIGRDVKPYQYMTNLDGRMYQDVYSINLTSGERKKVLTRARWFLGGSPDGTHLAYYDDGHFFTYELATGKTYKITEGVPATFADTEDDHNIVPKPPTRIVGWAKDGSFLWLSDNWDLWQVPVHGGSAINLTQDGRKDAIRYQGRIVLDPDERGIDPTQPQYVALQGEWTKKAGFGRLEPGKPGVRRLVWDDAEFGALLKPKLADGFVFTRGTFKDYPDFYAIDASFSATPKRLTSANPQQEKFLWSSGVRLVDYTSRNGDKLQAALFLPANYQPGKAYPTIVYIYEHLSDGLNRYTPPTAGGFNKSYYTSHGYAVLMPDINYKINDPGVSSVACVIPALEAAILTGVVDRSRVGLQGHSWGGYQTAFLITQTNAFKAACAGAPLTNLISMYSSVYWNSGSANQPIFESSQGRFTSGYSDNLEAYMRNSPVFHAKNVQTPLLLLHNDKDGAVDFTQGIEYFNTLRRLQKPVVMLQYKGENHGVVKPANRKDYTMRMKEFFDHHLMDKPAPDWLKEGIPHLKMDDHLKDRGK
jgi:dipeptidyl aminopeptidase/acylaminoacyl peptidase